MKRFLLKCFVVVDVDVVIVCFECSPNYLVDHGLLSLCELNKLATLNPENVGYILKPPSPPAPLHQTFCQLIPKYCEFSKAFITMYNPGKNSWGTTLNAVARQIEASYLPLPPNGAVLMLCIQVLT